jgi:hypothetical protein
MKPSSEPTDRSMLRDTMTSTIPVAMIAIEALWTERFQRFLAVRKVPSEMMLKPIQITASAAMSPRRRVSISAARSSDRSEPSPWSVAGGGIAGLSAIGHHLVWVVRPRAGADHGAGH